MNVVLSTHFDLARPVMFMELQNQMLCGLIDNFAGVFVSYEVHKRTDAPVYLTNFEELEFDGADTVAQKLEKDTIVIVVDTITRSDMSAQSIATLTNQYGLERFKLKESFGEKLHFIDGLFEEKEDETWIYGHKYHLPTCYFGIPIQNNYHDTDNIISLQSLSVATEELVHLVEYLRNNS
ncbi:hypothetical protein HGA88_00820 [Candidatus Roizmanbacteria bacterium]|nr:hypothetical protein [Candidatus Roizmanbacteria bacterium]